MKSFAGRVAGLQWPWQKVYWITLGKTTKSQPRSVRFTDVLERQQEVSSDLQGPPTSALLDLALLSLSWSKDHERLA